MSFPLTRRRRRPRPRPRRRRRCFLRRARRKRSSRFRLRARAVSATRHRARTTPRSHVVGLAIAVPVRGEEGGGIGREIGGRVTEDGLRAPGEAVLAVDLGGVAVGGGGAGPEVDVVFVGGFPVLIYSERAGGWISITLFVCLFCFFCVFLGAPFRPP